MNPEKMRSAYGKLMYMLMVSKIFYFGSYINRVSRDGGLYQVCQIDTFGVYNSVISNLIGFGDPRSGGDAGLFLCDTHQDGLQFLKRAQRSGCIEE